jgi:hypothetical protein
VRTLTPQHKRRKSLLNGHDAVAQFAGATALSSPSMAAQYVSDGQLKEYSGYPTGPACDDAVQLTPLYMTASP